jgi:hypothetical protein
VHEGDVGKGRVPGTKGHWLEKWVKEAEEKVKQLGERVRRVRRLKQWEKAAGVRKAQPGQKE